MVLTIKYDEQYAYEIGVDEAGRGPMFGRVYAAAVILPETNYKHELMKDSKKFTSKKKITECYEYIKENASQWKYILQHCIDTENHQSLKNQ